MRHLRNEAMHGRRVAAVKSIDAAMIARGFERASNWSPDGSAVILMYWRQPNPKGIAVAVCISGRELTNAGDIVAIAEGRAESAKIAYDLGDAA